MQIKHWTKVSCHRFHFPKREAIRDEKGVTFKMAADFRLLRKSNRKPQIYFPWFLTPEPPLMGAGRPAPLRVYGSISNDNLATGNLNCHVSLSKAVPILSYPKRRCTSDRELVSGQSSVFGGTFGQASESIAATKSCEMIIYEVNHHVVGI